MSRPARRSGQGARTRGALLRAGRRVLEERGYHRTRISDITEAANISVGTFYLHFKDKDDLFRQLMITVEDEVFGELTPRQQSVTEDPPTRIAETNRLYLQAFERNAQFWRVIEEAALVEAGSEGILTERRRVYRARTVRAIMRWQAAGLIAPDLDAALAAATLGSMTERCAYHWYVFGSPPELEVATEQLTLAWLDLLGIEAGIPAGGEVVSGDAIRGGSSH